MAFWGYNRLFHLILLLAVLVLYGIFYCSTIIYYKKLQLTEWYFPATTLMFLLFWVLRGLDALASLFPYFHYATLLLEFVAQLVFFFYSLYVQIVFTSWTFASGEPYVYFVYGLGTLVTVVFFLLVFKYSSLALTYLLF